MTLEEIRKMSDLELIEFWNKYEERRAILTRDAVHYKQIGQIKESENAYMKLIEHLLIMSNFMELLLQNNPDEFAELKSNAFFKKSNLKMILDIISKEISVSYNNLGDSQITLYEPKVNSAIHSFLTALKWDSKNNYAIENIWYCMDLVYNHLASKKVICEKNSQTEQWMINHNKGYDFLKAPSSDYPKALYFYNTAINSLPNEASTWHGLGLTYSCQNNRDRAIESWLKCFELEPEYNFEYRCIAELK